MSDSNLYYQMGWFCQWRFWVWSDDLLMFFYWATLLPHSDRCSILRDAYYWFFPPKMRSLIQVDHLRLFGNGFIFVCSRDDGSRCWLNEGEVSNIVRIAIYCQLFLQSFCFVYTLSIYRIVNRQFDRVKADLFMNIIAIWS